VLGDYLCLSNEPDKLVYLSNLLHDIKYEKNIDKLYASYGKMDLSNISFLSEDNFVELCTLATYVEQAFNNRALPGPEWTKDKRLFLKKPKFFLHASPNLVLHATQACLNHNVFLSRSDFEVV